MRIDSNSQIPFKVPKAKAEHLTEDEVKTKKEKDHPTTKLQLSKEARLIQQASDDLTDLESIREGSIQMAKDVLENWTSPSDEEIDKIFNNMFGEV